LIQITTDPKGKIAQWSVMTVKKPFKCYFVHYYLLLIPKLLANVLFYFTWYCMDGGDIGDNWHIDDFLSNDWFEQFERRMIWAMNVLNDEWFERWMIWTMNDLSDEWFERWMIWAMNDLNDESSERWMIATNSFPFVIFTTNKGLYMII